MRTRVTLCLAWAAAGCGGEHEACDALMLCAASVNPWVLDGLAAEYGDDGRCWAQQGEAACEEACVDELVAMWLPSGAPTCDPEPVTGEFVMSEPAFALAYWELTCELYADCYGREVCDDDDEPPAAACSFGTFRPDRAEACLTVDPPRCVEEYGGGRYVQTSDSCREICAYGTTP